MIWSAHTSESQQTEDGHKAYMGSLGRREMHTAPPDACSGRTAGGQPAFRGVVLAAAILS
ncbi:hypothetical protein B1T44_29885 [Mycobacterium persicum]|nr:hypothetical protein ABH39_16405 [Mycobacterium haemophilum]KLO36095.1 hypothetical protein ABH37_19780 [Mycobacterium haemophilum]ORB82318.1 hypothetical protein B1T44_29885 [Mycobacterium persicum]